MKHGQLLFPAGFLAAARDMDRKKASLQTEQAAQA